MSKLRSAALGLAILAGSAATATAQSTTPSTTPPAAGARHGGWRKGGDAADGQYGARGRMGGRMQAALFKGIDLSADQKARIKAIRERYQAEGKSLRESVKPDMDAARAARSRGDSTAARAAFERTAGAREKMRALRDRQMGEVRGVLTASQQTQFDANLADLKARHQEHGKRGGKGGKRA
jgi:Spy/CpxP family protein refolding chaperone